MDLILGLEDRHGFLHIHTLQISWQVWLIPEAFAAHGLEIMPFCKFDGHYLGLVVDHLRVGADVYSGKVELVWLNVSLFNVSVVSDFRRDVGLNFVVLSNLQTISQTFRRRGDLLQWHPQVCWLSKFRGEIGGDYCKSLEGIQSLDLLFLP